MQKDPHIPSLKEWNHGSHASFLYCMFFNAADVNISVSQRDLFYAKLATVNRDSIDCNKVSGFGILANKHLLAKKSILGFLPKWCLKKNLVKNKDVLD